MTGDQESAALVLGSDSLEQAEQQAELSPPLLDAGFGQRPDLGRGLDKTPLLHA